MMFKVGNKVKFIDRNAHEITPEYYPTVGTVGKVIEVDGADVLVEWPEDCGVSKFGIDNKTYTWWAYKGYIALVEPTFEEHIHHLSGEDLADVLVMIYNKGWLDHADYMTNNAPILRCKLLSMPVSKAIGLLA